MPKRSEEDRRKPYGLLIPAGAFLGFAVGFLINNVPVGIYKFSNAFIIMS